MPKAKKTKAAKKPKAAEKPEEKPPEAPTAPAAPEAAPAAPTPAPAAAPEAPPGELIGEVTNFFSGVGVVAIRLTGTVTVGDKIAIRRSEDYLEQTIESMQIDRADVQTATSGQEIGVKLPAGEKVHQHNKVYKI